MSGTSLALWLTLSLVVLGLAPTAWVLLREVARRAATRKAVDEVREASKLFGTEETPKPAELVRKLSERFDTLTIERAVLELLRSEEGKARELGSQLFAELGLVERYVTRVREARKWSERTHAAEILGLAGRAEAAPVLVSALRDRYEDDDTVKVAAAAALAKLEDPAVIPLLIKELYNVDERSSRNVAEALTAFGTMAVPALLELLVNRAHPSARVWSARILGRIGDPAATDDLVARLHDRDDLLRMAAAEALGAIADGRALQPLVRATLRDPAPQVRAHAAGAVAKIEGERAVDVLVAALADPDYATRLRALEAFETMRIEDTSHLEAALRDPNVEVRRRAALALERVGYLEKIIARLNDDSADTRARAYAGLLELGRVGLLDSIASYVHHTSFEVRAIAARACGELGQVRVVPLLLGAIDDESWPVRAAIAEALGRLRHDDVPLALVRKLTDAEEPVREAAAEALTSYGSEKLADHVSALVAAYDGGSVPIRTAMVVLAGRLGGDAAIDLLVRATADPSDGVRLRAVTALGGHGGAVMVEALVERLTDASLDVRMAAVAALGSGTNTEAFEGLLRALSDALPAVRDRIAEALSRGARDLLFLRLDELEKNPSLDVRIGVAWTLGKTGDVRAVPTLARFLRDSSGALRASSAGALAKIPSPETMQALLAGADDPDGKVRAAVVNALGRLGEGNSRVAEALERRVRDPDPFVRNRAFVALARTDPARAEARAMGDDAERDEVEPAARLVALALVKTPSTLGLVLDEIGRPGVLERIARFLGHEGPEVRAAFYEALHLEDPSGPGVPAGDHTALVERYEQVLRAGLDVGARRLAVGALTRLKGGRAVEVLADAAVSDPDEGVRMQATEALASQAGEQAAWKALGRAVADPSADVAIRATRALATRREPAVARALAKRLGAGSMEVQEAVETALATVHRDDPLPFVDWMMGVDIPELLVPAVRVLERIANPVTLPLLNELLRSRAPQVRAAAVRALGAQPVAEAAEAIDGMSQDPSEEVRLAVLDCLRWSGDAVVRTAPLRRDPSVRVRARSAVALERASGASARVAVKVLEAMLNDASPTVRAAAFGTLLASSEPEALMTFGRAWAEASLETRRELRDDPRRDAISEKLAAGLHGNADPARRKLFIVALGALYRDGYEHHVLPALNDPSADVRVAAVQALAVSDDPEVRARLAEKLSDLDAGVRDAARRSMLRSVQ
jgi:HEAT repeat protein